MRLQVRDSLCAASAFWAPCLPGQSMSSCLSWRSCLGCSVGLWPHPPHHGSLQICRVLLSNNDFSHVYAGARFTEHRLLQVPGTFPVMINEETGVHRDWRDHRPERTGIATQGRSVSKILLLFIFILSCLSKQILNFYCICCLQWHHMDLCWSVKWMSWQLIF